ncbi:S41 family peptidase [Streptococcus pneumoniae]
MKKGCGGCLVVIAVLCLALLGIFFYLAPRYGVTILPPSAEQYADSALSRMHFGLYADEKFEQEKELAREAFSKMTSYDETYPLLKELAQKAGGKHSHFYTPEEIKHLRTQESQLPEVRKEGGILYLTLPSFSGDDQKTQAYVEKVAEGLSPDVKGIVLDVWDNQGGRLDAMVSGFGVWLKDKTLFEIVYDEEHISSITFVNLSSPSVDLDTLKNLRKQHDQMVKEVPIAILTSARTASSAEILILTLQQLSNVKTFGQATAGYTTSNMSYPMYDGAELVLSTGRIRDYKGQIYENQSLQPNVATEHPMEDAKKWLEEQMEK